MAQLTAPVITATLASNGTDIEISGITSANASGYKVRWGTLSGYGREDTITPVDGQYTLDDTFARTTYYVAVKAVGDGVDYTDSDWSAEVVVVTEGTEDDTLTAPTVAVSSASYAYVEFSGIARRKSYRYQVATSEADLATAVPGLINGRASNVGGVYDLDAGTTYYFRFCEVEGKRCSAWTTSISCKTSGGWTNTIVVTSTAASGDGSLYAAIVAAQHATTKIVFDPSLDGATIYRTSNYDISKVVCIDATALPHGITIDGGGTCVGFTSTSQYYPCVWRGVKWSNVVAPSSSFNSDALIDCVFTNVGSDIFSQTRCYRCVIDTATASVKMNGSYLTSCVIKGVALQSFGFQNGLLDNCYFSGCTIGDFCLYPDSICHHCYFVDSTQSGTQPIIPSAYGCYVKGITQSSSSEYAYISEVTRHCYYDLNSYSGRGVTRGPCTDSTFVGCVGYFCANMSSNPTITRCRYYTRDVDVHPWSGGGLTLKDCVYWCVLDVSAPDTFINCTIRRANYQSSVSQKSAAIYNSLVGPGMTSGVTGANNLVWDESDPTSSNYVGKVFKDFANGDLTLKNNSPAIDAGDNQYVASGDKDLAGNERINNTTVDLGCYEYYNSQLDPPVYSITTGAGGAGSVAFVLPEGGVSFLLESAADSTFTNPTQYTGTTSPIAISGNSGTVYFRGKTIGQTSDENSDWSAVTTAFFDSTAPTVTPNIYPTTNDTIWRLIPETYIPNSITIDYYFTISDNIDPSPSYHWYIYDANNTLIDDGTSNLPNQMLVEGERYTLEVVVTDSAGNSASASCTLVATYPMPTYTYATGPGGALTINYTLPTGANGADVRYRTSGGAWTTQTGVANPCVISGLDGTYEFQLRATTTSDRWMYSRWTYGDTVSLDAQAPVITPYNRTVDIVQGGTEIITPRSVSDNHDSSPVVHYTYLDSNGQTVEIGGQTQDLQTALLPAGEYTIRFSAEDDAGNIGTATQPLIVRYPDFPVSVTTGPGGVATVSATLPTGASGWTIAYAKKEGTWQDWVWTYVYNAANPLIIEGLDGEWMFSVQAVSPTGTFDSRWSVTQTVNLDAYAPVLITPQTDIDITVGATFDLMEGVSATDNHTASPTIRYTITDANGQVVTIDGQTQDLDTADLDPGTYTVTYSASDEAGNVSTATRALKVRLAAPTYTITTGAGGTATISFTLPEGATGCDILPLFSESFNPPTWIFNAPNPCIVSGLNGPYIFYLHSTSPGGQYDSRNVKSGVYWLDAITPTVTVADKSRLEFVVGDDTVDLLAGVTATDDHDATVPLVYYLTDSNGDIVEVDGQREDIPSADIPIGAYTIVYAAEDSAGNKGYNDRPLLVLPTVLETPVINCIGLYNTTATISGLNVPNAYGYSVDIDGEVTEIAVPQGGLYAIQNLSDNAAHTIRAKALGDWEEPIGHYRDSGWSNTVTVIIGNPAEDNAPVITREQVTDRSITIGVSHYESSAGYFEILIAEDKGFSSPITLTKVPADEITIKGLKASTIYYLKLRAVFAESVTPYSNVLLFQTEELTATTTQDKLLYVRERIQMLRGYLADISNIDSVSIDGISESKYDREKLLRELADLEAEEARLANGGGRLTTMDIRWTIR